MEDYDWAIRTCQLCFVLRKEVLGLSHYDTVVTLCNLGLLYQCQRNYPISKKIHELCLDLQLFIFGGDHEDTKMTRECLQRVNLELERLGSIEPVVLNEYEQENMNGGSKHTVASVIASNKL